MICWRVGQSERAAYLAGIPTRRITTIVYVVSSLLAAVTGLLLAAYSGGAALDMSSDFLLMSIAVVVIGGTSITGGRASTVGIWGGALFLYLISTMLNVLGLGAGVRYGPDRRHHHRRARIVRRPRTSLTGAE